MEASALLDPKMWLVWGPLGLYALVMTGFVIKLYRDNRADRAHYDAALTKERSDREVERKAFAEDYRKLEDRLVTKAETWMTQYSNFSTVATKVVDAAMRRYRRGGTSHDRSEG